MADVGAPAQQIIVPDKELARQAVAALRGYAYQVWASALAWARLGAGETLLLEVADDYGVVSADALNLTQVKDTPASGATTLRTVGVVDAINRYWRFKVANPRHATSLSYLTTAQVGQERSVTFASGRPGLLAWRHAALDGADTAALRAFLLELPLDGDLKGWITAADDDGLREGLLRPIHWRCAEPNLADIEALLDEALVRLCAQHGASGVPIRDLRDSLLVEVLRCAVKPDPTDRQLTQQDLEERIARIASSATPGFISPRGSGLQALDSLNSLWTGGSNAPRPVVAQQLSYASSGGRAWLHGPSGIGKSALAQSLSRFGNRPWYSLDLRDQPPLEIARRLRAARQDLLSIDSPGGVILEDFNLPAAGAVKRELMLLLGQAALEDARVIITAYKPPAPSLAGEISLEAANILAAPRFDEDETSALIRLAGGDADLWTRPVHMFSGFGFPQLVAARVAGLRLRGWPEEELVGFLATDAYPDDVGEEREATRARLLAELPATAASLLYRLSLTAGAFDRNLALALAASEPAISEPGAALDLLVGPWLEPLGKDRIRVSPLVSDAGGKVLSVDEQRVVHTAIVSAILGASPIPSSQLSQLLASSLVAKDHRGLGVIVQAAVLAPLPNDVLGQSLFGLRFLRTDRPLVDDHSGLNLMLRMAQLKIAAIDGPASLVGATHDRLLIEADGSPGQEEMRGMATFTLATSEISLPAQTWFPPVNAIQPNTIDRARQALGVDLDVPVEDMAVFLFTYKSYRLQGIDDLGELVELMQAVPSQRREMYLNGFTTPSRGERGTRRSLVESAWLAEVAREVLDVAAAVAKLLALEQRIMGWPDEALAVEFACARVTLLAEYGEDAEGALAAVDAALKQWPESARLRRERGKVLFGLRRFEVIAAEADALLANVADGDPVDRAYTTRDVAVAAAEMGDLSTAIALMRRAEAAASEMAALSPMKLKLAADIAILTWRAKDREAGLKAALEVLERAAALPPDDVTTRAMVVMAEVLHEDVDSPGWDQNTAVFGIASRVVDAPDNLPKPPLLTVYYRLAQTEFLLGLDIGAEAALERQAKDGRIVVYEQVRQTRAAWKATQSDDPMQVVEYLPILAQLGVVARQKVDTPVAGDDLLRVVSDLPWAVPLDAKDDVAREFVIGGAMASLAFAVGRGEHGWLDRLKAAAVGVPGLLSVLEPLSENPAQLDSNDHVQAVLWSLARIGDDPPSPNELFMASAYVVHWLGLTFLSTEIAAALGTRIGAHWRHLATHQRFNLRSPVTNAPAILEAAADATDRAGLARLLLVAHPAVNVRVSAQVLEDWRVLCGLNANKSQS